MPFFKGAFVAVIGILYFIGMSACAPSYDPTYIGLRKVMEQRK